MPRSPHLPQCQQHKINVQQLYPCPCRRKARLKPIVLTEAFGCDRCASIFAVEEGGYSLVQVDGIDSYRRTWYWNGGRWCCIRPDGSNEAFNATTLQPILLATIVLLLLLLTLNAELMAGLPAAIALFVPFLVVAWLLRLRHRDP